LWLHIEDAGVKKGISEKFGVDAQALSRRIRKMRLSEVCATVEVAGRFGVGVGIVKEGPVKDRLESAGTKVSP